MLVENKDLWLEYRGLSPAFAERVWAKRREEKRCKRLKERAARLANTAERVRAVAPSKAPVFAQYARAARFQECRLQRYRREAEFASPENAAYDQLANRICRAIGVTRQDVLSSSRAVNVCLARHAIMYWAHRRLGMKLEQIAVRLGKDHTSCLHGRRAYPQKRAKMGRYLRPLA